jgi:hypothetical protein
MGSKSRKSPVKNLPTIVSMDAATPEPLLLDIKGAARVLSATTWTVRNLLWAKNIPFIKIGRRFLNDPLISVPSSLGQKSQLAA